MPTWQMWICRELPNLVLAVIITPLIVLPLWPLFEVANIWPGLCVLGDLAGISSAIGLVFGVPRRYRRFTPLLIAVVWWSEYKIILLMQTPHPQVAGWTLLLITGVLCALGIVQALRASPMPTSSSKQVTTSSVPLPYFFKKLLRARAAQHGFVTSLLLGGGLVFICNKTRINDSAVIALALTLLTSLYVVDVRALCRRLRPAEITTLRGTIHFVWNELSATAIATLLALSPLLWLAGRQNIASTLSAVALGLGIGLLVSTLLVPEQRNISSQVMATFLCIGINIAVSRLEPMRQLSSLSLYGIYLMAFLGFLLIAAMTEYQRNRFVWRSYDSPSNKT
ncbi:MAG TPA: hypothetical protein VLA92_01045 [Candidatus Saccharimonadales bacterium]|nr:hypothetical protein [Candidatus Saccharimonadales bacterium]